MYIEATEETELDDTNTPIVGDFIREEIEPDIKNEVKIKAAKDKVKSKLKANKTYKYRKHFCKHEENEPCVVEALNGLD